MRTVIDGTAIKGSVIEGTAIKGFVIERTVIEGTVKGTMAMEFIDLQINSRLLLKRMVKAVKVEKTIGILLIKMGHSIR